MTNKRQGVAPGSPPTGTENMPHSTPHSAFSEYKGMLATNEVYVRSTKRPGESSAFDSFAFGQQHGTA